MKTKFDKLCEKLIQESQYGGIVGATSNALGAAGGAVSKAAGAVGGAVSKTANTIGNLFQKFLHSEIYQIAKIFDPTRLTAIPDILSSANNLKNNPNLLNSVSFLWTASSGLPIAGQAVSAANGAMKLAAVASRVAMIAADKVLVARLKNQTKDPQYGKLAEIALDMVKQNEGKLKQEAEYYDKNLPPEQIQQALKNPTS